MRKDPQVIWAGPFPAANNGIAAYAERITAPWAGLVPLRTLRVHFSDIPRDYPLQVMRALAGLLRYAGASPKPLLHIQHCPFSTGPGSVLLALMAKALGFPLVTTFHEERAVVRRSSRKKHRTLVYLGLELALTRLSDAIVVHSQGQRRRLAGRGAAKARVIEFGVEQLGKGRTAAAPVVGCFGLISPTKGIETVVDACAIALGSVPGLRLVIAGAVPSTSEHLQRYSRRLQAYVAAKLGDRGEVLRNLPQDEFERRYQQARLVAFGLRTVTQSTTFYRAIAYAKPVVATDAGGVGEVTRREGVGLVVPVGDATAMAEAIVRLLTDRKAYRALAAAARDYGRRRTWEVNAAEHLALYESVAGRRFAANGSTPQEGLALAA